MKGNKFYAWKSYRDEMLDLNNDMVIVENMIFTLGNIDKDVDKNAFEEHLSENPNIYEVNFYHSLARKYDIGTLNIHLDNLANIIDAYKKLYIEIVKDYSVLLNEVHNIVTSNL